MRARGRFRGAEGRPAQLASMASVAAIALAFVGGAATDARGEVTGPSVTIEQAAGQFDPVPAGTGEILFTVQFSDSVDDFTAEDVTVSPPGLSVQLTGSGSSYTASVQVPADDALVVATIAEGVAHDTNANPNLASTSLDNSVQVKDTHPGVTVSQEIAGTAGDPAGPSKPSGFRITFDEPVESFTESDLSLSTSDATGAAFVPLSFTGPLPGNAYTVLVSATGDGVIALTMAAGAAYAVGHDGEAAFDSEAPEYLDNEITWDQTSPTVTINQGSNQSDPTSDSPIEFDVVFSEDVISFDGSNVTLGGTAGATTATVTGGPTNYTVQVSGMTDSGTVTASIASGQVVDAALNSSAASTSTDNTVDYQADSTGGLSVTINTASGQDDPTSSSPIAFDVVFSAAVSDFATGDVTLGGTAGATTATVTGGPTDYTVQVSGMTASGTVIPTISAGVAHDASNTANAASTSTDNTVDYIAAPDLTVTKTHTGDFTQGQSGQYTITVSNVGSAATTGTVTVVDTLPSGLTGSSLGGTGWSCTLATSTCTRSDSLAAGNSYPSITLSVAVSANAPSSVTNSVTVSGGGESDASNDTATDPTSVVPPSVAYQIQGPFAPIDKKTKVGTSLPIKIAVAIGGTVISDGDAVGLLSPTCRVFVTASSTPSLGQTCMTYNADLNQFQFNWKIPKNTVPTTIQVTVTVKNADGTTNVTKSVAVTLMK